MMVSGFAVIVTFGALVTSLIGRIPMNVLDRAQGHGRYVGLGRSPSEHATGTATPWRATDESAFQPV
jgi:hypothetical protein